MKKLAFALVIIGACALIYGIIDYSSGRTTIEMGSMSASITENGSRWMFAVILGGIAVIAGLAMSASGRTKV